MADPFITIQAPSTGVVTIVAPTDTPTYVLSILNQGPPGPPGSPGAGYVHVQSSSAAVWTVAHNLGYRPGVTVTTTGGVEVEGGEVLHLSTNVLTITFDVAFAGFARLV